MSGAVIIIGAGPAGLIAAENLAAAGHKVDVYDRKPSVARKFLMAGRGGLNLTHSEDIESFLKRYGAAAQWLKGPIEGFMPQQLRDWADGLGQETFIGSSGRVFPKVMKASPLLRNWLQRLESLGVAFHLGLEWQGWTPDGKLAFSNGRIVEASATLLALGGASWPRLGSDGSWVDILAAKGVDIAPLRPANSGFNVAWSEVFKTKFAGAPLKAVALTAGGRTQRGEAMVTAAGLEGGAVYALSGILRAEIENNGAALLRIDLKPGTTEDDLATRLAAPQRGKSLSEFLRRQAGLSAVAGSLLREAERDLAKLPPRRMAQLIKSVPLKLLSPFPIDRAISTAGGIRREALDEHFMLRRLPGVFAAGEMLDWDAPTGGYLLQACFATGVAAARGIDHFLG